MDVSITTQVGRFWHMEHDVMFCPCSVTLVHPLIIHSIISKTWSLVSAMLHHHTYWWIFLWYGVDSIHIQFKSMHEVTSTVWREARQPSWCRPRRVVHVVSCTSCRPRRVVHVVSSTSCRPRCVVHVVSSTLCRPRGGVHVVASTLWRPRCVVQVVSSRWIILFQESPRVEYVPWRNCARRPDHIKMD